MIFTLTEKKKLDNSNSIDTTNLAQLNVNNTFSGNIISTSNNNNFISKNDSISLFKIQRSNGDDLLWIGKKDPNSNQVYISSRAEHIIIETPSGKALRFDVSGGIQATNPLTLGTIIKMGFGADKIRLTAEDRTNKTIALGPYDGRGKLDVDLENNAKIINVPNPVNNNDVANKAYVDGKITTNTYNQTIALNNEYLLPEGGTILNVQVFRKRTADNAYISSDTTNIGYQLGIKDNGRWYIWCSNVAVSGYSTDFKIVVTRKN